MSTIKKSSEIKSGDIIHNAVDDLYYVAVERAGDESDPNPIAGLIVFPVQKSEQKLTQPKWLRQTQSLALPFKNGSLIIDMRNAEVLFPEPAHLTPITMDIGNPNDPNVRIAHSIAGTDAHKIFLLFFASFEKTQRKSVMAAVEVIEKRKTARRPKLSPKALLEAYELRLNTIAAVTTRDSDITLENAVKYEFINESEYKRTKAFLGESATKLRQTSEVLNRLVKNKSAPLKDTWESNKLSRITKSAFKDFKKLSHIARNKPSPKPNNLNDPEPK